MQEKVKKERLEKKAAGQKKKVSLGSHFIKFFFM